MRRAAAVLGVLAAASMLTTACGGSSTAAPRSITVAGDRVPIASLVDAEAGLCAARAAAPGNPVAARAAFLDRSHTAIHTVARALEDLDRAGAASLLEAKEKVEAGLDGHPPTLTDDIAHLAAVYRSGLGRLAISAPPCEK